MKKQLLISILLSTLIFTACSKEETDLPGEGENTACGDGICDEHETQNPDLCPEDCETEDSEVVDEDEEETEDDQKIARSTGPLKYQGTYIMEAGTHRPEVLVNDDDLYLLAVHPDTDEGIQHRGYIFDASDPSAMDFDDYESFALTPEGSDHRAIIMDDEIVVVYQVNVMSEDMPEGPVSGPAEAYSESQKLMMARFSLDGEEIFRDEILSTTDFEEDNFPDMCMLAWSEDSFLVSTGASNTNPKETIFKIREVSLDTDIITEEKYEMTNDYIASIGNSMFPVNNGFLFFSSTQNITVTEFDKELNIGDTVEIEQDNDLAYTFPTGVVEYGDYYIVGYSSHDAGDPSIESNPLYPAIMILTKDLEIILDGQINELFSLDADPGSGHVHPTLAIIDDRLFYTWSSQYEKDDGNNMPQVRIEEFELSFN